VIQLVIRVGDGDARVLQITNGASNVSQGHVVSRIVVEEDDQDAAMMTIRGKDDEVVQSLEVLAVPRQDGPPITDGMGQVHLVAASDQAHVGWNLDIVPVTPQ
jgi:hypothetical protein